MKFPVYINLAKCWGLGILTLIGGLFMKASYDDAKKKKTSMYDAMVDKVRRTSRAFRGL